MAAERDERVERLDTGAGPGQNATLSANLAAFRKEMAGKLTELRKDFDKSGKVQDRLKADMVEVKGTLGEILDRLPPPRETRD